MPPGRSSGSDRQNVRPSRTSAAASRTHCGVIRLRRPRWSSGRSRPSSRRAAGASIAERSSSQSLPSMSRDHHSQGRSDERPAHSATAVARGHARFAFDSTAATIEASEGESVAAALWAAGVRSMRRATDGAVRRRARCSARWACASNARCGSTAGASRLACTPVRAGLDVRSRRFDRDAASQRGDRSATPEDSDADVAVSVRVRRAWPQRSRRPRLACASSLLDENATAGGQVYRVAPGIAPRVAGSRPRDGDALRARARDVERRHALRTSRLARRARAAIAGASTRSVPTGATRGPRRGADRGDRRARAPRAVRRLGSSGRDRARRSDAPAQGAAHAARARRSSSRERVRCCCWWRSRSSKRADASSRSSTRSRGARGSPTCRGARVTPDLVARGIGWLRTLRRHRVPMLHAHVLRSHRAARRLRCGHALRAVDGDEPSVELDCDAVCCGFGLMPATELTRLAGASHAFDAKRGGWHARVDDDQRCDVPLLYVAGDGAGVAGAAAAPWQGRVAALSVARDLHRIDVTTHEARARTAKQARNRASRFGTAMTRLANAGDGVARFDRRLGHRVPVRGTHARALDAAIDEGATTINDLKAATRCGMGPCGGRLCEDAAARLIALAHRRPRARRSASRPDRPPLRPVDLDRACRRFRLRRAADRLPLAAVTDDDFDLVVDRRRHHGRHGGVACGTGRHARARRRARWRRLGRLRVSTRERCRCRSSAFG